MSWSLVACLAVCIAVSIIVVLGTIGGLGGTSTARILGTAVACVVGYLVGQEVHKRFFA